VYLVVISEYHLGGFCFFGSRVRGNGWRSLIMKVVVCFARSQITRSSSWEETSIT
jgi:hypothetical protein